MTDRITVELRREEWFVVVEALSLHEEYELTERVARQVNEPSSEVQEVRENIVEIQRDLAELRERFEAERQAVLTLRAQAE